MTSETVKYPRLLALLNKAIEAKLSKIVGSERADFVAAVRPKLVSDFCMDPAAAEGVFNGTVGITAAMAVFLGSELDLNPRALMDTQTDDELALAGATEERVMTKAEKKAAEKASKPKKAAPVSHSPLYGNPLPTSATAKVSKTHRRPFDF